MALGFRPSTPLTLLQMVSLCHPVVPYNSQGDTNCYWIVLPVAFRFWSLLGLLTEWPQTCHQNLSSMSLGKTKRRFMLQTRCKHSRATSGLPSALSGVAHLSLREGLERKMKLLYSCEQDKR